MTDHQTPENHMTARARTETLTPAQWDQVRALRSEYLNVGLDTRPADRPAAEQAITAMYARIGKPAPQFIWTDSPATAVLAQWLLKRASLYASLRASLGDSLGASLGDSLYDSLCASLRDSLGASLGASLGDSLRWDSYFWGQQEWWIAFYAIPQRLSLVTYKPADTEALAWWSAITRSCGWWWPYGGLCIISERPSAVHIETWDAARGTVRLHRAGSPAMTFRDGWKIWAWHGRQVPQWVIEQPAVERIAAEGNVEVRRCAIESLGWDRFTAEAGLAPVAPGAPRAVSRREHERRGLDLTAASVPDPGNPGQHLVLYDVPERLWGSRIRLLMCTNGSVERSGERRKYGLTVPAHIEDPLEAAAWTAGLTRDQYALMQRRT